MRNLNITMPHRHRVRYEDEDLIVDLEVELLQNGIAFYRNGASVACTETAEDIAAIAKQAVSQFDNQMVDIAKRIEQSRIAKFGKINDSYSAIKPGPLNDNLAKTFSGRRYTTVTLEKDTFLYRAGTADKPLGQFFSSDLPQSAIQTKINKAIPPEWPGGTKAPIDTVFSVKIPAGTKVYVGEFRSQSGFYIGGELSKL